ncbi:MAG: hypothetical protein NZZ41_00250 [Candidatus Dojkabacteria bacterium]|nr:hypothetical protein [Candidatus Dojkabacteria bacterium]
MKIKSNLLENFCFLVDENLNNRKNQTTIKNVLLDNLKQSFFYKFLENKDLQIKNIKKFERFFSYKKIHKNLVSRTKGFVCFSITNDDILNESKAYDMYENILNLDEYKFKGNVFINFYDFSYILPMYILYSLKYEKYKFFDILNNYDCFLRGKIVNHYNIVFYFSDYDDFNNFYIYRTIMKNEDKNYFFWKEKNKLLLFNKHLNHEEYHKNINEFKNFYRKDVKFYIKYKQMEIAVRHRNFHDITSE